MNRDTRFSVFKNRLSHINNPRSARALRAGGQYKCREFPSTSRNCSFLHVVVKLLPRDVSEEEDHERTAYLLSLMKKVGPLAVGRLHYKDGNQEVNSIAQPKMQLSFQPSFQPKSCQKVM